MKKSILFMILLCCIYRLKSQADSSIKLLPEIAINSHQKPFEKTMDGTRYNIEHTMLSKSVNANELLTKLPGVSLQNNKPQIFGTGEALIYLNGKEITLESYKSLPVSEIKSIEVITNPSAKYDAKAKAIIMIYLKKGYLQGTETTVNESITINRVPNYSIHKYTQNAANVNINYRINRFNSNVYYANELGQNWMENKFAVLVKTPIWNYNSKGYYEEDNVNTSIHYYKLGMGYDFKNKSTLSAQYDGIFHQFNLDVKQNSDYEIPSSNQIVKLRMKNDAMTKLINHSLNLNYNHKIDQNGGSLFLGGQYNNFTNQLDDNIVEKVSLDSAQSNDYNRLNRGYNTINLYTLQSDLIKKIKSNTLEIGAKYYYVSNQGKINFYSKPINESNYSEKASLSNQTEYTESVPAFYFNYKTKIKQWNISLGLRSELTNVKGYSYKYGYNFIDTSYIGFFPSAKVQYQFNENWSTTLSYSHKINRPIYQDLDPFLWYLDSLTSIKGNSTLQPEYIHQINWNTSFKDITLRSSIAMADNPIWMVTQRGSSGENNFVYTKANFEKRYYGSIALDKTIESKNYNSFYTLAINYSRFSDSRDGFQIKNTSPQIYFYTYHSYTLPKLCTFELTGEYYGKKNDGFTDSGPYYYVSIGASKSMMKDRLNIQFLFNDVFRTAVLSGEKTIQNYTNTYAQRYSMHYIRLSIQYKFGTVKNYKYNNLSINEKEYNRIKK